MVKRLLTDFVRWIQNFAKGKFHRQNPNLPYYITILVALVIFIVGLNAFVQLTDELAENELGEYDNAVTGFVLGYRSEPLTRFFEFMTDMGDRVAYIVISIALGIYFYIRHRSWKFIAQTILVLLLSTVSNIVIKKVIHRERPALEHLVTVNTLSYPSGHSMSAMAFYGFLIYLVTQMKMGKVIRTSLIILLTFIILAIGTSRIYLGVHYPSDVAAGFIGGLIWVTFCIVIFNVIDLQRERRKNSVPSKLD